MSYVTDYQTTCFRCGETYTEQIREEYCPMCGGQPEGCDYCGYSGWDRDEGDGLCDDCLEELDDDP